MKIKHRRWIVLTGAVFTASLLQGCVVGGEGGYGYQQPYGYEDRSYGYGGWGDPYGGRSRDDAYRGYEQRRDRKSVV